VSNILRKLAAPILSVSGWIGLCAALSSVSLAQPAYTPTPSGPSMTESMRQGMDKFGKAITPTTPVKPADDPVSLQSKGKPGVDLYVAVARLHEESGKLPEAEAQYKKALKESPDDLRALLGYARLKDRMGLSQDALNFYQKAAKTHAQEPSVFNNLAVHYARRGMLREAVGTMERAIQLRPKEIKYRNNMAMLLVEAGNYPQAFAQLREVHDEAAAHYNLGFLLNKKGQTQAAAQEFTTALSLNPSLVQARQWLDRINQQASAPSPANPVMPPAGTGVAQYPPPVRREEPRVAANPSLGPSPNNPAAGPYAPYRPSVAPDGFAPGPTGSRPSAARQLPPPPRYQPNNVPYLPYGPRRSDTSSEYAPLPPDATAPQRLPPTSFAPPAGPNPPRYGESAPSTPELIAPLPPGGN
jgi:Flp pilus assembly protein TadD